MVPILPQRAQETLYIINVMAYKVIIGEKHEYSQVLRATISQSQRALQPG